MWLWLCYYRAPEGRLFRPYDLLVVSREQLGLYEEYFTLSANGVMTIRKGVQAEFVPLAEWVRQQSLFDTISAIGYFKNYITGRAFRRWHKVCTLQIMHQATWHVLKPSGSGHGMIVDWHKLSISRQSAKEMTHLHDASQSCVQTASAVAGLCRS